MFELVSPEMLAKLADYLKKFQSPSDSAEQFWYLLGCELRKIDPAKFNYTPKILVTFGQAEDKASFVFLKDLQRRKAKIEDVIQCLKKIKCNRAVCLLEGRPNVQIGREAGPNSKPELLWPPPTAGNPPPPPEPDVSPELPRVQRPVEEVSSDHPSRNAIVSQNISHIDQETSKKPPPPVIETHPKSVRSERGQTVSFHCMAGPPDVTYDWYRNSHLYKRSHSRTLMLKTVNGDDVAEYFCVAMNMAKSVRSNTACLTLESDIVITTHPCEYQELRVGQEDEEYKMYCHAHSRSKAKLRYEWQSLSRSIREYQMILGKNKEELCMGVQADDLTGSMEKKFCCKVTSSKDSQDFVYSTIATVKMKTVWLTRELEDVNALLGERTSLSCEAKGVGTFRYLWLASSTREGHVELVKETTTPNLPFSKLLERHEGYYCCQVQNQHDFILSRLAHVKPHLHEEDVAVSSLIVVQQPCAYYVVKKGKPFKFVFKVVCTNSKEDVTYQWYFLGSKISGEEKDTFFREYVSEEDHCGSYWCEARAAASCVVSNAVRVAIHHCEDTPPPNTGMVQKEVTRVYKTSNGKSFARDKVALLIGNQRYKTLKELDTPQNDLQELQKELSYLDYKVFSLVDLSHADMQAALAMFYESLVSGSYALFYYSGHGFSSNDHENYFVPTDTADEVEGDKCLHFQNIIKRMQATFCRPFLVADACKVVDKNIQISKGSLSYEHPNNICYIWSAADEQPASDASVKNQGQLPCSLFNTVFRNSIKTKKTKIKDLIYDMNKELGKAGASQYPSTHGSYPDCDISMHDPIMVDGDLERTQTYKLNQTAKDYQQSLCVPPPQVFSGAAMLQLEGLAELHLTFSHVLTNVWYVQAELHHTNDKMSSASIIFVTAALEEQGVSVSQKRLQIHSKQQDGMQNGHQDKVCARVGLEVRGLQKLRSPLTFFIDMSVHMGQEERRSRVHYVIPSMPFISSKFFLDL